MRRPVWLRFDLRALGHPVWWAALALLAVNDHLLKRAGVLPGWFTGKLSDFAFLIVAPVLAASLLPAVLRPRRTIAPAGTVGLFTAAKISPLVSGALVAALRHVGIAWRLWTDPTDLVALVVVPVSIALMRAAAQPAAGRRRALQRAGVVLGAVACVATSAPEGYPHNPFLLNGTSGPVSVNVTWLLREVPCGNIDTDESIDGPSPVPADLPATLAASLTPGDLDDPITVDLVRGQVAALDGPPPPGTSPAGMCAIGANVPGGGPCVGAILDAPPATPVLMVAPSHWDERQWDSISCDSPSPQSRCQPMLKFVLGAEPDAVTLKEVNGVPQFVAGAKVRMASIDPAAIAARTSPAGNCRALREQIAPLLQSQACAVDADCVAVDNLSVPGLAATCDLDVNLAGARALSALGLAWDQACVRAPGAACTAIQPAVCRGGTCAPACPGEQIPGCPPSCSDTNGTAGASCTTGEAPCTRNDGPVCNCVNGTIACGPAQPSSATCPLSCNDWPGGGTYTGGQIVHPTLDGGAPLDAGPATPDAGARDGSI